MVSTNQKLTLDTQRNTSMLLKKIIKPQEKRLQEERNREELQKKKKRKTSNKMTISTYLSIITLNAPIKT